MSETRLHWDKFLTIGSMFNMFLPCAIQDLSEHVWKVVDISSSVALSLESLLLKVVLGHVRSWNGEAMERAMLCSKWLEFYLTKNQRGINSKLKRSIWTPSGREVSYTYESSLRIRDFSVHADIQVVPALIGQAEPNWNDLTIWGLADHHFQLCLEYTQFPESRTIPENHIANAFLNLTK